MNREQIEYIRHVLIRKMDALQSASTKMVEEMKQEDVELADPLDRAALEVDRVVTLIMRDRDQKLIQTIRDTLERIDEGLFGRCNLCRGVLPMKRILAAPLSRLCVKCQQEEEKNQKKRGYTYADRHLHRDSGCGPDFSITMGIQNPSR